MEKGCEENVNVFFFLKLEHKMMKKEREFSNGKCRDETCADLGLEK